MIFVRKKVYLERSICFPSYLSWCAVHGRLPGTTHCGLHPSSPRVRTSWAPRSHAKAAYSYLGKHLSSDFFPSRPFLYHPTGEWLDGYTATTLLVTQVAGGGRQSRRIEKALRNDGRGNTRYGRREMLGVPFSTRCVD